MSDPLHPWVIAFCIIFVTTILLSFLIWLAYEYGPSVYLWIIGIAGLFAGAIVLVHEFLT